MLFYISIFALSFCVWHQFRVKHIAKITQKLVNNSFLSRKILKNELFRMIPNKGMGQNNVNQRIKEVLQKNDLSVTAFSKEVGLPQATVNRQLMEDNKVSLSTIKSFLKRFPKVSAEWLLRGVGDECCGVPDEQLEREIAEETGRVQSIGDNSSHNTQTMTDSAIAKENEMLRKSIEEKNEEIKFLRSLIQRNAD